MKDERYKQLLKSRVWRRLRMQYISRHPLCEICEAEGRTRAAQEVHHIVPISRGMDRTTMRRLAYDIKNLQSLCSECHHKVHEEMEHGTKTRTRERAAAEAEVFMKTWTGV